MSEDPRRIEPDEPTVVRVTTYRDHEIREMSHGLFRIWTPSGSYLDSVESIAEAQAYIGDDEEEICFVCGGPIGGDPACLYCRH